MVTARVGTHPASDTDTAKRFRLPTNVAAKESFPAEKKKTSARLHRVYIPVCVVAVSPPELPTATYPSAPTIPCGLNVRIFLLSVGFLRKVFTCNTFPIKTGVFQGRESEYRLDMIRIIGLRRLYDAVLIGTLPESN